MHLPDVEYGFGRASQRLKRKHTILTDAPQVIPHSPADVQRAPRVRADAAASGEESMTGLQGVELKVADSVMLDKSHHDQPLSDYSFDSTIRMINYFVEWTQIF